MSGPALQGSLDDLSAALWRERQLLEAVLGALRADEVVRRAEVGPLIERLRVAGLLRAVRVDVVARLLQVSPSPTLRQLAAVVPEPWPLILDNHREGLRTALAAAEAALRPGANLLSLAEVLD